MTREDYIKNLQSMIDDAENMGLYEEDVESLQFAIKALEREPKLQNRCFALTQGQMCLFCPYECEHKAESEDKE